MIEIIAEIGSVHDGSFGNALQLISAAAKCGATTVKFQTHIAEAETIESAPSPAYFSNESRMDYFRRTSFSLDQWRLLASHAAKTGVGFLSSPFSIEAVDLLESVGVRAYKVPSGEISNVPLLERLAATRKPVLLSSGMSSLEELDLAVSIVKDSCETTVMQCSSIYPCPPEHVGLNVLEELSQRYGLPVGFSDHTMGLAAPISAAALGAAVIEKHFTFSKLMYGSDAKHSMEPAEFSILCGAIKEVAAMRANPVRKDDISRYAEMKRIFEKSIVASRDISVGEILQLDMLAFKKPGDGIPARDYLQLLGKRVIRPISADQQLVEEDLD